MSTKKTKIPTASEDSEQAALVAFIRSILGPDAKHGLIASIPNGGGKLGTITGARLKRTGLLKGWPDIVMAIQDGKTIWIEMKKIGGKLSKVQIKIHAKLRALGHLVIVGYGAKDAAKQISESRLLGDRLKIKQ